MLTYPGTIRTVTTPISRTSVACTLVSSFQLAKVFGIAAFRTAIHAGLR